jgi:hypothetical protein
MKVIDSRERILTVVDRYAYQFRHYLNKTLPPDRLAFDPIKVWEKLRALDLERATPDDIEQIIGNDSWTQVICDVCSCEVELAVRLEPENGIPNDPDYPVLDTCLRCLKRALEMTPLSHAA